MAGLKSLCENHSSGPECVAPTVLRIMLATVPALGTLQVKISSAVGAAKASSG